MAGGEKQVTKKESSEEINLPALISVMLAGILLGFIAHELFHILTIDSISSLTVYFGGGKNTVAICCLSEGESAMEEIAYFIQAVVTIGWIILNTRVFAR